MEHRAIKSLPSKKGKARRQDLPLEVVLDILQRSAWSSSTKHARKVCLVSKAAYDECWPALHRIVAIRNASSFHKYARRLVEGTKRETQEQLIQRQEALESLYINNTPQDALREPNCASCLTMILTVAKNLKKCHFEEHWSDTNSWEKKERTTPCRLIKNPLRHIAGFPSLIGKVTDNGSNTRFAQLPPKESRKPEDWVHLVPKLTELTISAHTLSEEYLRSFNLAPYEDGLTYEFDLYESIPDQIRLGANYKAFENLTRLHLYFGNLDNQDNLLLTFLLHLPKLTHLRLSRPNTEFEPRYDPEGDTNYLADMSYTILALLDDRPGCVRLQSVILQLGSNFDRRVLYHMNKGMKLERSDSRVRLIYFTAKDSSHSLDYQYHSNGESDVESEDDSSSSSDDSDTPLALLTDSKSHLALLNDPKLFLTLPNDSKSFLAHQQLFRKGIKEAKKMERKYHNAFSIANTKKDTDAKCEKLAFYQFAKRAGGGEGVWARDCMTLW